MKLDDFGHVDVCYAVAVSQHKSIARQPCLKPLQSAAGLHVQPGADQMDDNWLGPLLVHGNLAAAQFDRHVVVVDVKVDEELLYEFALVTERNHEFVKAARPVKLHDVPQDGHAADFDHWLRANDGLLSQSRTQSAG